MTDEELCGWLRSMLPASGFAPTENWAPWLGADRIEAQAAEIKAILDREADTYRRHDAKVDALEAENERLREALKHQGGPLCAARYYTGAECTCGVSAALGDTK
jgi:hypothetical protein